MRTRSTSRWIAYALLLAAALVACTGPSAAPAASTPAVAAAGASAPAGAPAATEAPAAGLRLEGTPPIPDPLRDRLQQYLNTRSATLSDIADDGRSVLVATRFGDSNQVHLVASPGAARRQLTFSREPVRGGAFVPGK
ncbi:MAG TPA: hypothetical protein VNO33_14665, partial [Kofleriaceae bacterium]|nr:hypothetical protein [Kofleriaceae bacterium]